MEAVRDFLPSQDTDQADGQVQFPGVYAGVEDALAGLQRVGSTAVADAAFWGFRAASDFAGRVEELSRTVEYFQLVAAAAVDRTRRQATAEAGNSRGAGIVGWTTGWRDTCADGRDGTPDASAGVGADAPCDTDGTPGASVASEVSGSKDADAVDDGYRNTTEFLRARLRISAPEARRRLALAEDLLPEPHDWMRQPKKSLP
ncbi:MAG: hypothetical protein JWO49_3081, partial [Arthrobacter sp.]|nr:hypothetical protein [Arthrobacter sp.]